MKQPKEIGELRVPQQNSKHRLVELKSSLTAVQYYAKKGANRHFTGVL